MPDENATTDSSEGELFRVLIENLKDAAVFTTESQGRIRSWNAGAERLLGYSEDEIIGRSAGLFLAGNEGDAETRQGELNAALDTRGDISERWLSRKDGSRIWASLTIQSVRPKNDGENTFAWILHDRTEWRRRQDAADEHSRLVAFNTDVGLALIQAETLSDMLRHCAEAMVAHLGGAFARIWTVNTGGNMLELQASAGMYTHLDGAHSRVPVGQLKIGLIAQERVPHLTNSVPTDSRVSDKAWAKRAGMAAFAGYPLLVEDRLVGVMAMFARDPLSKSTLDALASVANVVASAIMRKRSQAVILEQQQWYRVTLASIGDAVIATDNSGLVLFANGLAETLTGWTMQEAVGKPLDAIFRILHEDTHEPVENPVSRVLRDGTLTGMGNHTILVSKDGQERPIDDSAAPIQDESGGILGTVMVFRDVSAARQAEQMVRQSVERFQRLMEQAPFSVQIFTPDGRTVGVNRAWEELWGATLDDLGDYNILQDPQLESLGILSELRRAVAGEAVSIPPMEYDPDKTIPDLSKHDDPRRWVSAVAYPLKDDSGRVREVVLVHADITAQRRAEEALRETEGKFRLLADTIPQLAWVADPDGYIFWYNQRWHEYTGTTPQEMEGWGWQKVHDPQVLPDVLDRWIRSISSGEPFDMVFPLRGADGLFRPFLTRVSPLRDDAGKIVNWFGTNTDISDQQLAESNSRFLANASAALAAIVDYESTLGKVARLAVPYFADWCTVDMAGDDGSLRRLVTSHADQSRVDLANELYRLYPPRLDDPYGPPHVFRTGEPELVSAINDSILEATAQDERHLNILRELELHSYLSVPMPVRGRTIGVLTFVASGNRREYGQSELDLAVDLAHRAATAIDNALLYNELREADRLKDEFMAMLAHELRNPLGPIRNALHILKQPGVDRSKSDRARNIAERQVRHMSALLDDLLDVSRI
ncbi:MAG: PAS domain S-box protein, partial [Chloroflexi bacterium]|nr:PAS domain S-box protein [Chloroflexota bacterium]